MFFTFTPICELTSLQQTSWYFFFLSVRWTLGKRPLRGWKNLWPWARESAATTASDWLAAASPSRHAYPRSWREENTPPPLQRRAVTGLTVIWGDVLSADFQIHKSLRSDQIEAAWKARRGDWHVWVALWAHRCKLHANAPSCICLYVCVCLHNLYALCFILPTFTCICIRVNAVHIHTADTLWKNHTLMWMFSLLAEEIPD